MDTKTKKASLITTAVVAIAAIAIIVILTIMMGTSSSPKKSIEGLLTNLKAGDIEKAQEFIKGKDLVQDEMSDEEVKKHLFDKLSWKITKITEEKENATIELEITNKDFKEIISNFSQKILKLALSGENLTEKSTMEYLVEELKNEDVKATTVTATIQAEKEDGKWKIVGNEDLINAVAPGLQEAMNNIQAEQ